MNVTLCDVCHSEVSREVQPRGHWQFGDTQEILCMCSECIEATSLFLRARQAELGTENLVAIPFSIESKAEVVEEAETEEVEE